MQLAADEKADLCCTTFKSLMIERKDFKMTDLPVKYQHLEIEFINIDDGKMLCALIQYVNINRKYYLYLLCSCARGVEYECKFLTDDQYGTLYRKSHNNFENQFKKFKVETVDDLDNSDFKKLMDNHCK